MADSTRPAPDQANQRSSVDETGHLLRSYWSLMAAREGRSIFFSVEKGMLMRGKLEREVGVVMIKNILYTYMYVTIKEQMKLY